MKALITGAAGFVGNHLARLLLDKDIEVWGTLLNDREKMDEDIAGRVHLMTCDIRDAGQVRSVLTTCRPDYIFHLAAQSNVARSWENPTETFEINVLGTIRLLDEIACSAKDAKTLLVGSAEEYGKAAASQGPIKENTPLDPVNPYGASKAVVSMLFKQYWVKFGLPLIYVRAFNHIGPGQAPGFVTVDFARQIAAIETGAGEPVMKVGNLEARRDFTDVRDVVKAYWALVTHGSPGEVYNVASGRAVAIQKILDILLRQAAVKIEVRQDEAKMRASDIPGLLGDITKIEAETGWKPTITVEQSLKDILDYWRDKVKIGLDKST